jgi:putative ABC transport system permease protein
MRALNRKLLRDLRRMWAQSLAIALVMAAGAATLILGIGAHDSLSTTRAAYYEANRFADLFADVTRAPKQVAREIAALDGVAEVTPRVVKIALVDLPGMAEPAAVQLVSLPSSAQASLNEVYLRSGNKPQAGHYLQALISAEFAAANYLSAGDRLSVLLNGRRTHINITGTALSPEFIYLLGPGDLMPDPKHFGVVWMPEAALAASFDLDGAFSNLAVKLQAGANPQAVMNAIDLRLKRYGGTGSYGRKDQISHAFLDAELMQLRAMSRVLPPIFLLVSAFLVNMTLTRLIALEREQIGLLKAIGYGRREIALHYIGFVTLIALAGILIGFVAGAWLGRGMAELYARFFNFPFLVFSRDPSTYAIAAAITLMAAIAGALRAVVQASSLAPAVAMSPPAPPRYQKFFNGSINFNRFIRTSSIISSRHLLHWPWRTAAGILGTALAVAILVGSLWAQGAIEYMIDISFQKAERQDASISFTERRPISALHDARHLPGVLRAEPFRTVAAKLRLGQRERRVAIVGMPSNTRLSRALDADELPLVLPPRGLVISDTLAGILHVRIGDGVELELMEGEQETHTVPVTAITSGYFGLGAMMDLSSLNRLLGEGPSISGVNIAIDESKSGALFAALRETPLASFIVLQKRSVNRFRETLAQNITIMSTVYISLAAIIAFGVVYNSARISLSEQGREMASLRVLGFTRAEVSSLLLMELAVMVVLALPLGWVIGYGFGWLIVNGFASELYRVPLVIGKEVYAYASLVVLVAATVSALVVRRRIDRLDMIAVLKTRE